MSPQRAQRLGDNPRSVALLRSLATCAQQDHDARARASPSRVSSHAGRVQIGRHKVYSTPMLVAIGPKCTAVAYVDRHWTIMCFSSHGYRWNVGYRAAQSHTGRPFAMSKVNLNGGRRNGGRNIRGRQRALWVFGPHTAIALRNENLESMRRSPPPAMHVQTMHGVGKTRTDMGAGMLTMLLI